TSAQPRSPVSTRVQPPSASAATSACTHAGGSARCAPAAAAVTTTATTAGSTRKISTEYPANASACRPAPAATSTRASANASATAHQPHPLSTRVGRSQGGTGRPARGPGAAVSLMGSRYRRPHRRARPDGPGYDDGPRDDVPRAVTVAPTGVDPVTFRFSVERSTN